VPHELFNYKQVIAVVLVACIAYFWKRDPALGDDLTAKQNWTVNQVAVLILLQNVATVAIVYVVGYLSKYLVKYLTIDIDSLLPYATIGSLVLYITVAFALFFSYIRQPLKTVGLSREYWGSLSIPGVRWTLVAVFMSSLVFGLASVRQPFGAANAALPYISHYLESDGSLRPIGYLLVEQACGVFLVTIEEIHYRGLLYGALRKRMGPLPVRYMTAIAFMMAHDWIDPVPFIMGWLTATLRENYQSLIPGIVLHLGWNTALSLSALTIHGIGVDPATYYFCEAGLAAIAYVVVSTSSRFQPKSS